MLDTILEPGSAFSPAFSLVVDVTFAALFVVLVTMAIITRGNLHAIALVIIAIALYASVKWFVYEFKQSRQGETASAEVVAGNDDGEDKKSR